MLSLKSDVSICLYCIIYDKSFLANVINVFTANSHTSLPFHSDCTNFICADCAAFQSLTLTAPHNLFNSAVATGVNVLIDNLCSNNLILLCASFTFFKSIGFNAPLLVNRAIILVIELTNCCCSLVKVIGVDDCDCDVEVLVPLVVGVDTGNVLFGCIIAAG